MAVIIKDRAQVQILAETVLYIHDGGDSGAGAVVSFGEAGGELYCIVLIVWWFN